jgi:hypothetical protein
MRIFKLLGTPTEQTWFGCTELPEWHVCRLPGQRTFTPALPLADFGPCFREIWAPTFFGEARATPSGFWGRSFLCQKLGLVAKRVP